MARPSDLPKWNETEERVLAPNTTQEQTGFVFSGTKFEKPKGELFNYLLNNTYKWIKHFDEDGVNTKLFDVASGTANTITLTIPSITSYEENTVFMFKATADNTGATTVNVNSLGAVAVVINNTALTAGQIENGKEYFLRYSSDSKFELVAVGGGELDISGLPSKTTPTGNDSFVIADSASGNELKNLTLTDLVGKIAGSTSGGLNDSSGVLSFYPYGLTTASTELTTSDYVVVSDSSTPKKITLENLMAELGSTTSFQNSKTQVGYQKLPRGLIIQWGYVGAISTGGSVSLPISFPNATLSAVINHPGGDLFLKNIDIFNKSQLQVFHNYGVPVALNYIAIGY